MKTLIKTKSAILVTLLAAFLSTPIEIFGQNITSYSNTKSNTHTTQARDKNNSFNIRHEGEITISDNDKDITAISNGGYIEIEKSTFGNSRKLVIENNDNKLVHKYFIGGREKEYHPDGKKWLEEILPEIVRTTNIGAKSRVDRYYKTDGVNGVLTEIGKIESDFAKTTYIQLLLNKKVSEEEVIAIMNELGEQVESDYYLAEVLQENEKLFLSDKTTSAYVNGIKNIESDYYISQILNKAIDNKNLTDAQLGDFLDISNQINSDFYLKEVLTRVMDKRALNQQNIDKIIEISKNIDSDLYKVEVLTKALKTKNISEKGCDSFVKIIGDIDSDYYLSTIIEELASSGLYKNNSTEFIQIIKNNIGSDFYKSSIYQKLIVESKLTDTQIIELLDAVGSTIDSDHYLSETLMAFSGIVEKSSEEVKEAYWKAAKSIESDTYYGKLMRKIND